MACCDCCCENKDPPGVCCGVGAGKTCCQAPDSCCQGEVCCPDPRECCGPNGSPVCCPAGKHCCDDDTCKECCGPVDCPEGQNCCGGNCQDEPCEPCCCINGVIQAAGSYTQETCEACEVIVNCYEFMATTDPCPDGWESVLDGCSRITHPTSCDECSGYSCSSYTVGACGTWYSDCLSATKWSGYVNLTADGYYLDCIGTHFYFGPSGIVYYPTAADEAGFYNSEDDCLAALDDIVADPTTYNPNGCDWPPGLGTGCLPVCIDTNNPLP